MAVDDQSEPLFLIFQGTGAAMANNFRYPKFHFFAVTQKRREIRTWFREKKM